MSEKTIYHHLLEIFGTQPNPVVLEFGAHMGQDTIQMLRLLRAPRMYIFEPDPRNLQIIKARNILAYAYLTEAAVGAAEGEATFYQSSGVPPWDPNAPPGAWAGSSSLRKPKDHLTIEPWCKFDHSIKVKVVTLDGFCQKMGLTQVDFIWADVQGAEGDVVRGAPNTFRNTRYFYVEYANREVYEGQVSLTTLLSLLPGTWEIVHDFGGDVLLKNATLAASRP